MNQERKDDKELEIPNDEEGFARTEIGVEIDLFDLGGLLRLQRISDLQEWIKQEDTFWEWIGKSRLLREMQNAVNLQDFSSMTTEIRQQIQELKQQWNGLKTKANQARSQQTEVDEQRIHDLRIEWLKQVESYRKQITNRLKRHILDEKKHYPRLAPHAGFLDKLKDENPAKALFALDEIMTQSKEGVDPNQLGISGRIAALKQLGYFAGNPEHLESFLQTMGESWRRELDHFKGEYQSLQLQLSESKERIEKMESEWSTRKEEIEEEFKSIKDAESLYMKLDAPRSFWGKKNEEHKKRIWIFACLSFLSAVLGIFAIYCAATTVLPEQTISGTIPWRNIGIFILIATFGVWIPRLFVKLLLSNIHLQSDAREREVMISTYLALMKDPDSELKLNAEQLSLLLVPIFRPSTTGVIKEDGGPSTLTDIISRISGK